MHPANLQIELERSDGRYRPGELIVGVVRVVVHVDTHCNALTLARQWKASGRGTTAEGPETVIRLFAGDWQPGTYTYPFTFPCPEEPTNHRGRSFALGWHLDARADISWEIDPVASAEFAVEVDAGMVPSIALGQTPTQVHTRRHPLLLAAVFTFFLGLTTIGVGVESSDLVAIAIAVALLAVGAWLLSMGLGWSLARRAFKRLSPHIERVDDDTIAVVVNYATSKVVNSVTATLVVEERVLVGSNESKTFVSEILHRRGDHLRIGRAGEHEFRVELRLPDPYEVGWSFMSPELAVAWYVALEFDIEGWPDFVENIPLGVRPSVDAARTPYRAPL